MSEIQLDSKSNSKASQIILNPYLRTFLEDSASGFLSGISQILVGQPLDLAKVLVQTRQYSSTSTALLNVTKNEGPLALYKGASVPLIGTGIMNMVLFNFTYVTRREILRLNPEQKELTMSQYYGAGTLAGVFIAFLASPVEQIRILLQTQPADSKIYKGPIDAMKKIYHADGMSGIFRGLPVTILRDAHAHGVWFVTYEYLIKKTCDYYHCEREEISPINLLTFGGIAGITLWGSTYPIDVIKTVQQSDGIGKNKRFNSFIDVYKWIYQTSGYNGFWKGISATLVRAFPVNAAVFATAEITRRLIKKDTD